ncbi:MAG: ISL3 family transposase [archaeon]|nr:ISL3 family transposase [archaeon]
MDVNLHKLLGFKDVKVLKTRINLRDEFCIYVESTKKLIPCRICGKETELVHGDAREIELRHLPILGKNTYIFIKPKRGKCKYCDNNPTTNQRLDWYEYKSRNTKAFEDHVLLSLVNSTMVDVSVKEQTGLKVVEGILNKKLSAKANWKSINRLGLIGVDEISLKKGHRNYVTIITSRYNGVVKLLGVIKGKEKAEIKGFFSKIPNKLRKTIDGFCIDMYEGFSNAIKEVFGNKSFIIVDRFHVARLYRKSLVSLRKKELERLRKDLSEKQYKNLSKGIRILCSNKEFVTKTETKELYKLFRHSPDLKIAYSLCRKLTVIFNTHVGIKKANNKLNEWIEKVKASKLKCYNKFIATLSKWQNKIIHYFKNRNSSGFVEGVNNKIKVLKRRCYGIFDVKNLYKRIFLDLSGYDVLLKNSENTHPIIC